MVTKQSRYRATDKGKAAHARQDARRRSPVGHDMTAEEYEAMFVAQSGVCALCHKHQRYQRLSRDHDHVTGRVRGLLCMRCNVALGAFEYDAFIAMRTAEYLYDIHVDLLAHAEANEIVQGNERANPTLSRKVHTKPTV